MDFLSLFSQVKFVKTKGAVRAGEKVVVAVSGGDSIDLYEIYILYTFPDNLQDSLLWLSFSKLSMMILESPSLITWLWDVFQ